MNPNHNGFLALNFLHLFKWLNLTWNKNLLIFLKGVFHHLVGVEVDFLVKKFHKLFVALRKKTWFSWHKRTIHEWKRSNLEWKKLKIIFFWVLKLYYVIELRIRYIYFCINQKKKKREEGSNNMHNLRLDPNGGFYLWEKYLKCVLSSYALSYRIVHFDLTTRLLHAYEMEKFSLRSCHLNIT
jgi:hypothetical protein